MSNRTETEPPETRKRSLIARLRFGIKPKLLLLLLVLNLLAALAFATLVYTVQKHEIIAGVDARLNTAVASVSEIAPPTYHGAITGPGSVAPADYERLARALSHVADAGGFTYVYTYMMIDGRWRTTATSATPAEWRDHQVTPFFSLYDTAPPPMYAALADGRPRYDEYADSFGRFRSLFTPMKDSRGRVYIVGADLGLSHLEEALNRSLRTAVMIAAAIFTLSMVAGVLVIERIVKPLSQLTDHTRRLVGNRFQISSEDVAALNAIGGSRRDEVGSLAEAMAAMNVRLLGYLSELERATAERVRIESELSAAHEIQMGMLPRIVASTPISQGLDIHALLRPAKAVGGDLYDFFQLEDGRVFMVIGDVSGKGVPAALFMARTITLFRAHAGGGAPISQVMTKVNTELCRDNTTEMFVTAFAAVFDPVTGGMAYCDGGHEAPFLLLNDETTPRLAKPRGVALGILDDFVFAEAHVVLKPGEGLVAFTDGVSEAMAPNQTFFGVERIAQVLARDSRSSAARVLCETLDAAVAHFSDDEPQSDDIAILAVRRPL